MDGWITRKVDTHVITLGEELGVNVYVINPPLICTYTPTTPVHAETHFYASFADEVEHFRQAGIGKAH